MGSNNSKTDENYKKVDETSPNLKINNSNSFNEQSLLHKKRGPETKISENPNKKIKNSENKNEVLVKDLGDKNSAEIFNHPNQMSLAQIKEEKEKIKKSIKESQKRLNELEIIEKYKNELKEQINNKLSFEQENDESNIRKTVRQTISSYYKENKSILEPFLQGLDQNGKNYIKNEINKLENDYSKTYVKTQLINNNNYNNNDCENDNRQIIDLDENEKIKESVNPFAKFINKSKVTQSNESKNMLNSNNAQDKLNLNSQKNIKFSKYFDKEVIRNHKIKESFNDQNNQNLLDNNLIIKSKKNQFNNYSFKCLTNDLNFEILKGTKEGMISLELENNGSNPWPQKKTFLEFDDSKENINIPKISLEPLNPGLKTKVDIILKNLDKINLGKYYICLVFKVDGAEYGNTLLNNIEVIDNINKNRHKTIIRALRKEYDFSNTMFSNTLIGNALEEFKTFEGAVNNILQGKN